MLMLGFRFISTRIQGLLFILKCAPLQIHFYHVKQDMLMEILKDGAGRLLFDSASEGLLVANKSGQILVANHRLEEMFGYASDELIGQPVEVLIPMNLRHKHVAERTEYNKAPRKRSMGGDLDLCAVRKDASEFPVEISLNHLKHNEETLIVALVTDITERKEAKEKLGKLNQSLESMVEERTEKLKESQLLYRTISRNFPNGTINVFDRDLNYVFAEGQELFRYKLSSEALVGTSYLNRLPEDVRDEIGGRLKKVFEGHDSSFEIETRGLTYKLNAVGLRDSNDVISQILLVEQNITDQKIAQSNMQLALEKERDLNELKSRFVSMASHEFRTPLSTILSSVNLLKKAQVIEEEQRREKHLNRIRASVQNLTAILNDFLSLDKLEEGLVHLNVKSFDIRVLIIDLIEEIEGLKKPGQNILFNVHENCIIHADEQMVRNVMINLISNALKYSPENSDVVIDCSDAEKHIEISVSDSGIGIPQEEQEHLFGRFFRATNAFNIQGTGLGLHIVKRYVDLLKGDIRFVSSPETGTTFSVSLPKTIEHEEDIVD